MSLVKQETIWQTFRSYSKTSQTRSIILLDLTDSPFRRLLMQSRLTFRISCPTLYWCRNSIVITHVVPVWIPAGRYAQVVGSILLRLTFNTLCWIPRLQACAKLNAISTSLQMEILWKFAKLVIKVVTDAQTREKLATIYFACLATQTSLTGFRVRKLVLASVSKVNTKVLPQIAVFAIPIAKDAREAQIPARVVTKKVWFQTSIMENVSKHVLLAL